MPFLLAALSLSVDSSTARWHWWVKLLSTILLKYYQKLDQNIIKIKIFSTAGSLGGRSGRFWDTSKGWLLSLCAGFFFKHLFWKDTSLYMNKLCAGQPSWYYSRAKSKILLKFLQFCCLTSHVKNFVGLKIFWSIKGQRNLLKSITALKLINPCFCKSECYICSPQGPCRYGRMRPRRPILASKQRFEERLRWHCCPSHLLVCQFGKASIRYQCFCMFWKASIWNWFF